MDKLSEFTLSDIKLRYFLDSERNIVGMDILPHGSKEAENRRVSVQSLVQLKILGDKYSGNYFGGSSMKYSQSTEDMKYIRQETEETKSGILIKTYLKNEKGVECIHIVSHNNGNKFIEVNTELINNSDKLITLEMLSSFSLFNISPFVDGAGAGKLNLYRARSRWSSEGRLIKESLEDLQLEDGWTYFNANNLRFGQVGSMPVKGYFPFMVIGDEEVMWGVQMGIASSWQMELTRSDDGLCISGGIADREFGHWMRTVNTGEKFITPKAVISVVRGDISDITHRLLSAQETALDIPECEENLPVIFNEYCTTWGNPSHENIAAILDKIQNRGIDYFVIDCGWYKEDGIPWHCSMGDYEPSKTLFKNGIDKTVSLIKEKGMKAGIWFEIENVGEKSKVYDSMTDCMLKRDGEILTTVNRRFWDMNNPKTEEYLTKKVIDFLKEYNFDYIKADYNETIGIGCDNEDSLGEGLRQNMNASAEFFRKMKREIPELIIENCASGGNRLEPLFMSLSSMASFSDAHECVEIPIIAANLHRLILPRQSQIWCVIRKDDSLKRIAYSVSAGLLGRLCLSGDVTDLSNEQWNMIDMGIAFYKKAAPIIKSGKSYIYENRNSSDRHPEGWQCVRRDGSDNNSLAVIHTFGGKAGDIKIPVGNKTEIAEMYPHNAPKAYIKDGYLNINSPENFSGIGLILK